MTSSINPSADPLLRNSLNSVGSRADSLLRRAAETTFETELSAFEIGTETSTEPGSPDTNVFLEETSLLARLSAYSSYRNPSLTVPASENLTPGRIQIPSNIQGNGYPQFAAQNNNPGNLRFAHQPGASLGVGGFAQFATPEDGYHALVSQVRLDANRGLTLAQYISKYAPPTENDTNLYIEQASQALGVDSNTPLANISPDNVAVFQARKESGTTIL